MGSPHGMPTVISQLAFFEHSHLLAVTSAKRMIRSFVPKATGAIRLRAWVNVKDKDLWENGTDREHHRPLGEQHGTANEKQRLDFQHLFTHRQFLFVVEGPKGGIRGILGVLLGVLMTSWGLLVWS